MSGIDVKNYHVKGIILSRRNFFEADKIVTILSEENGLIDCVVKSARRSSSKLSGVTELFIYGEFYLVKGKNLDILISANPKRYFKKAKKDLHKIPHFFLISEVLTKLLPHEVPNKELFKETIGVFDILDKKESFILAYAFIYKALVILGYGLSIKRCAECHALIKLEKENALNFDTGGVICRKCQNSYKPGFKSSDSALKVLSYIGENTLSKYSKVTFNKKTAEELSKIVNLHLSHIYRKEMKSLQFMQAVEEL